MNDIVDIIFVHMCCSQGFKELLAFKQKYEEDNNVKLKVTTVSYLNARDYAKRFNFDIENLRVCSYIIFDKANKIIPI